MPLKPPLRPNQAILSTDTQFDLKDYFLVEIKEKSGKFQAIAYDIEIDDWIDYIKTLQIDKSNNEMTAYCLKGCSVKNMWESIPQHEKIPIV